MKKQMGALALVAGAFALSAALLQFAPRASAAPQRAQTAAPDSNRGLPWAYGFATPADAAPAAGRGGAGGAAAGGGAGRGGAAAAPAAPAAPAEDTDAIRHVPGSNQAFSIKQIDLAADWFPEDHPKMPDIVAKGRRPEVNACGFCHYPNGKGRPNNSAAD
jgi:hypothetical protein